MNSDPEREDALVDAMLRDENWQTASAALKAEAMRTFGARQRVRRLTRWASGVAALAAVIAGVGLWFGRPAPALRQIAMTNAEAPKTPDKPGRLTDAELVAAFPKGSCFIAEVDGRKELIFFDPKAERAYVARSAERND
jgi:hypothetical protein